MERGSLLHWATDHWAASACLGSGVLVVAPSITYNDGKQERDEWPGVCAEGSGSPRGTGLVESWSTVDLARRQQYSSFIFSSYGFTCRTHSTQQSKKIHKNVTSHRNYNQALWDTTQDLSVSVSVSVSLSVGGQTPTAILPHFLFP